MKTLTVIDAFGFFFRSYYALPPLKSSQGHPTGLLTGFINFVSRMYANNESDYIVFCVDSSGKSFRNDIFPDYKANRSPAPEDLKMQIPIAIDWIKKMGFHLLERQGFEADDLIASITTKAKKEDILVKIISHDKDMYQLIENGKVVIFDAVKNRVIDEQGCFEKFEVYPKDFINFQAILGDSSDNVPGVRGVGQKGASKLINEYSTLENIYENIEKITAKKTKNSMVDSKEMAFISRELVTLKTDLFDDFDFKELTLPEFPIAKISNELDKYSIKSIQRRSKKQDTQQEATQILDEPTVKKEAKEYKYTTLTSKEELFKVIEKIPKDSIVAFDTETDDLDTKRANIVGFSFAFNEEEGFYVPIGHNYLGVTQQIEKNIAKEGIEQLFKQKVVGHNLKFDLKVLEKNFQIKEKAFRDSMIMAWLLDPSLNVGLDKLANSYFSHEMIKFKDMVGKGENFSNVLIEDATKYAGEDALFTYKIYQHIEKHLNEDLQKVLEEVEMPFVATLGKFEESGIKIDCQFLENFDKELGETITSLQQEIYTLSKTEFNLNSPKQLGSVLFETMGLKAGKKTKTGYSTDEKTLRSLIDEHEVIQKLLEYREIHKLKSTYSQPILERAKKEPDHRIHTNFLHTGTATGRLSSKDPNLQNIPVKTELGRKIRGAFIAEEEKVFIGFDYSQIELRLLGHFSNDSVLINAFHEDKDIHLETANKIFGEELGKERRSLAKSINFGLIYGMGSKKLSEEVGITTKEAKSYIEGYFASFPTVKSFLEGEKESAKTKGYADTLLKRRRYFDFENASARFIAAYEREAVNTIFQGSAADLIKMSMNQIDREVLSLGNIKPILQIHDELIYEVKESQKEFFIEKIQKIMEEVYPLKVPLKVSVNIGKRWSELK